MNTIKSLFLDVAHDKKSVSDLIKVLTDEKMTSKIGEDEKNAYQAFCCALLAKEAKNMMQKGQYIQEYDLFIRKSLFINSGCIVARLIRLQVEQQLENVIFVNHISEDLQFLSENMISLNDDELIILINKILNK